MLRAFFIASALVCALSGCVPTDKFYEGPDGDYGKSLFAELQARNLKGLQQRFDPKVLATISPSKFEQMAVLFPPTPPRSVAVVFLTTQTLHSEDGTIRRVAVGLQYEFETNGSSPTRRGGKRLRATKSSKA